VKNLSVLSPHASIASGAFIVGAITMPLCCGIMAHLPKSYLIFTVPVVSLLVAGALTVAVVIRPETTSTPEIAPVASPLNHQLSTIKSP